MANTKAANTKAANTKTGKTNSVAIRKAGKPSRARDAASSPQASSAAEAQIAYSSQSLHELFQRQTMGMLERADLSEEQKQSILIGMSCPCCGGGGMSYTVKLKSGR